ncbi:MAG: type II toxin-antitoxin system RelB/DinJ family antitoxin [Propionibacteriaceae bacterium]|jgi:DNA-damage-inducible protein J|nr:type II toxin-antitoxin system RelB/DinJ family antitoxin [Propionibacteriaceae bacterium]
MAKDALIQVRTSLALKQEADSLFESLGLDTPTAVRMFLTRATRLGELPFPVTRVPNKETQRAIEDAIAGGNVMGPYDTAADLIAAALAGADDDA